ncbi:hypothetical protein EBQ93_01610 [bacterium]|nr:hypothetical protein [bacterium]
MLHTYFQIWTILCITQLYIIGAGPEFEPAEQEKIEAKEQQAQEQEVNERNEQEAIRHAQFKTIQAHADSLKTSNQTGNSNVPDSTKSSSTSNDRGVAINLNLSSFLNSASGFGKSIQGSVYSNLGWHDAAAQAHSDAATYYTKAGDLSSAAQSHTAAAQMHEKAGNTEAAQASHTAAADAHVTSAVNALGNGDIAAAKKSLTAAGKSYDNAGHNEHSNATTELAGSLGDSQGALNKYTTNDSNTAIDTKKASKPSLFDHIATGTARMKDAVTPAAPTQSDLGRAINNVNPSQITETENGIQIDQSYDPYSY